MDDDRQRMEALIAEGNLEEAGNVASLISFKSRIGQQLGVRIKERQWAAYQERCRNDPDMEAHCDRRGMRWRMTREAILQQRMYASLVEREAQEAAQEVYKRERERGAAFWLDVAQKELADAIADGEDLRELARLSEQVDRLKHMAGEADAGSGARADP
jgi:hypothetical protein